MAEASECSRAAASRAAAPSPADSLLLLVMAPALEDVVEEEDVFLPQHSALKSGTAAAGAQEDGLSSPVKQLESDFLPLTIRKQVSYRLDCMKPAE
ncbi:hypothetical protein PGIGA_G00155250 [Pangasianodon gigas]|uniref:Uncharacterized protein n=1 Tax=Pangasianodon gigas TaxID=30993 RepID=A0ACC5XQM5_PANGG|nr:hypothetical protein [Pangasianodon gigas]